MPVFEEAGMYYREGKRGHCQDASTTSWPPPPSAIPCFLDKSQKCRCTSNNIRVSIYGTRGNYSAFTKGSITASSCLDSDAPLACGAK